MLYSCQAVSVPLAGVSVSLTPPPTMISRGSPQEDVSCQTESEQMTKNLKADKSPIGTRLRENRSVHAAHNNQMQLNVTGIATTHSRL